MANEKIHEYVDECTGDNLIKDRVVFDTDVLENGQWVSKQCPQSNIFNVMMGTQDDSGLQIGKYTTAQINAIPNPIEPNIVYNTTIHAICFFDGNGWRKISHSAM